jgi:hypothetical protein
LLDGILSQSLGARETERASALVVEGADPHQALAALRQETPASRSTVAPPPGSGRAPAAPGSEPRAEAALAPEDA